jgi:branched-chain amino acid transport system substrate-binding protein
MSNGKGVWVIILIVAVVLLVGINFISYQGITGNVVSEGDGIIRIGWMGPLTGDAASYGESIKRGVELANKDSGLKNIKITYEDSKCEGKEAVNAINKLISVDRVEAIIGEVCSGATLAAAPIAGENNVVLISSSSTSPELSNSGSYIFRTVPSDALQGAFGAELVYERGYEKLAVLFSNEEYGVGFNKVLEDSFKGEVVSSEAFERGSTDLRSQLTKIKNAKPDAIYIISNSPDSAVAALQQIREIGLKVGIFGSEGLKSPDTLEAGSGAEGLIITSVSTGSEEFIQKHIDMFGEEPGPFASQAYDAFTALALTIKKGASTGEEIRDELKDISFEGESGKIEFDSNGDISGNYNVEQVVTGKFVQV